MTLFRRFFPLYLVIFIGFFGYSMTLPLFTTLILSTDLPIVPQGISEGGRTILLGFLLFLYPFGQFIGCPILGALSDHFGRKRVLIASLAFSTLFYLGIAIALTLQSLPFLCIALFLAGLSEGNISIAQSGIADVSHGRERRAAFGLIYTVACTAYVVGPLLGGLLSNERWGYATPFWVLLLLLIATLLFALWRYHEHHRNRPMVRFDLFDAFVNMRRIVTDPIIRPYYLVNFLVYMAAFGFFRAFPMIAVERFGLSTLQLSLLIAWVSVPIFLANTWIVPRLPERWSGRLIGAFTAFGTALGLILFALPSERQWMWVTLFIAAFFIALCQTQIAALISHAAPPEQQGRVMGNNQALQVGAEALAASAAGFLAAITIATPLFVFALCGLGAGWLLLWRIR